MAVDYPAPEWNETTAPREVEVKPRRPVSRIRSSFFGARSRDSSVSKTESEAEVARQHLKSSQSFSNFSEKGEKERAPRRRIRKSASKASMSSMALDEDEQSRKFQNLSEQLARISKWNPTAEDAQGLRRPSISAPFNFTHFSHTNPQEFAQLKKANPQEIIRTWNNSLVELHETTSARSRPSTACTAVPPSAAMHLRDLSMASTRSRAYSNASDRSAHSIAARSASDFVEDIERINSPDPNSYSRPMTPPSRVASRQCGPILENPEDDAMPAVPFDFELPHAITTMGPTACPLGSQSPESKHRESSYIPEVDEPVDEEAEEPTVTVEQLDVPELTLQAPASEPVRERPELPRLTTDRLLSVKPRPLSTMSTASDTLNGNLAVPVSPLTLGPCTPGLPTPMTYGRSSSRMSTRMSRRLSGMYHLRTNGDEPIGLDSWAEDIDWCYEHELEAHWDGSSPVDGENSPSRAATPTPRSESYAPVEEQPNDTDEMKPVEKRLTAFTFEDRLLLPPSPQVAAVAPRSPRIKVDSGFSLGGCELPELDDQSVVLRAANTVLHHRSLSNSPSVPDLIPGRSNPASHRDITQQLDAHIALLSKAGYSSPLIRSAHSSMSQSEQEEYSRYLRTRANSEATCLTLMSDTDTVTATETNEAITPASSAHNSMNFSRKRSLTTLGLSYVDPGRSEKGLSFPAAMMPGVVEFGPNEMPAGIAIDDEFMQLI